MSALKKGRWQLLLLARGVGAGKSQGNTERRGTLGEAPNMGPVNANIYNSQKPTALANLT
jgi:hypothetical protein